MTKTTYVDAATLLRRLPEALVWWSYGDLRTLRLPGGLFFKKQFADEHTLESFLSDFSRMSARMPSSFGEAFDLFFSRARLNRTIRTEMPHSVHGNWQETFIPKKRMFLQSRAWFEYDLVSAYAWAGMSPLPDSRSIRFARKVPPRCRFALIRGSDWTSSQIRPPHLMQSRRPSWATLEEMERYELRGTVHRVLSFDREIDLRPALDAVRSRFRHWKEIFRAYWGLWAAQSGPRQHSRANPEGHLLPNPWKDTIVANHITARIKMRLAEYAARSASVYADQVMIPFMIQSGRAIGDWAFKKEIVA